MANLFTSCVDLAVSDLGLHCLSITLYAWWGDLQTEMDISMANQFTIYFAK